MMDRNLGATSATKGDVGALGLLYQWGRKDPFLGSSSISSNTIAKSTIAWPLPVSSTAVTGIVDYVTSHPTTFVTGTQSTEYDWQYSSKTLWTPSETAKSIYDPCPSGWRVPDGGDNGIWSKAGFGYYTTFDSTNEGMSFSISSPSTWYPASGFLGSTSGRLDYVGIRGNYWSASLIWGRSYSLYFTNGCDVDPSVYMSPATGLSVRCLQE